MTTPIYTTVEGPPPPPDVIKIRGVNENLDGNYRIDSALCPSVGNQPRQISLVELMPQAFLVQNVTEHHSNWIYATTPENAAREYADAYLTSELNGHRDWALIVKTSKGVETRFEISATIDWSLKRE